MTILRDILSGAVWMVAARWATRGIGLISAILLARLLSPVDFGVAALAMFAVALVEVFSDAGLLLHLIRHPDPDRSHFDTVFTLQLMVGVVSAVGLVLLAPAAAAFFHEPRLVAVIRVLALRSLIIGLENPGIALFRKNMAFNKDFEFLVLNKAVSFVVTVGLAVTLRSYWALVIGSVVGPLVATIQSYRMHPFRPRLDLSAVHQVWGYSFWMLVQSLLLFLNERIDELLVGRIKSTSLMGYYTVAADVASAPILEIVAPLSRVLFPGFAKLTHDAPALSQAFGKVLSAVAIVAFAVSTGIALVAGDLTVVLLGPKWLPAVPVLRILAIAAGLTAMTQPVQTVLNATGRPRNAATLSFVRQALLVSAMLPAALWYGLGTIALARAVVSGVSFVLASWVCARQLAIPMRQAWGNLGRPALAALVMTGVVIAVQSAVPPIPALRLASSVAAGVLTYPAALLLLWRAAGRPNSVEADVLELMRSKLPLLVRQRGAT